MRAVHSIGGCRGDRAFGTVENVAELAEMRAQLEALLPVMRALNAAANRLVEALPQSGEAVSDALVDVNAAIDDYCSVSLEHSGLLNPQPT